VNIVVNAFSAKIGGGQTYVKNLLVRLPDDDFSIYIFAPDDFVLPLESRITKLTTSFPVNNPFARAFWERFVLPGVLKRIKADVLFCPGGIVNTKVHSGCRVMTMFRNMLPFDNRALISAKSSKLFAKNWLLKQRMLSSMRSADLVIFISDYARSVIEAQITVKRALTIPHGAPGNFLVHGSDLERPKLPFPGNYILYVSRFEFYKRHIELICAYSMLPDRLRASYKLLIVGGHNTPWGEAAKKKVSELRIDDQVVFLGEYPYLDLPALYKNASLFVFMSSCENCPNILLEAMGAGVPVLCSDYQPMPEFGGDSVYYVSPDDPEGIRNGVVKILEDCGLSAELGSKAARRAELYSWDHTAQETWSALLSL